MIQYGTNIDANLTITKFKLHSNILEVHLDSLECVYISTISLTYHELKGLKLKSSSIKIHPDKNSLLFDNQIEVTLKTLQAYSFRIDDIDQFLKNTLITKYAFVVLLCIGLTLLSYGPNLLFLSSLTVIFAFATWFALSIHWQLPIYIYQYHLYPNNANRSYRLGVLIICILQFLVELISL